ncbi:MAG TPA: NAD-binding protein [Acidimicrobiales bacterium]|nr:NAD-binding protein [Acidimicrobiales bacterium]
MVEPPLSVRFRKSLWEHRWIPLILGAGAVLCLGLIGYGRIGVLAVGGLCPRDNAAQVLAAEHLVCSPLPWSDRLYFTLQLFKGSTNGSPPYPLSLEIARWAALGTTLYAAYRALGALFADRLVRFRIRQVAKGHVVVCGLGSCGTRVAHGFRSGDAEVISVELRPTPGQVSEHRDRGMFVIEGDAAAESSLRAARVARASTIVVCCGNDAVNARVARAARGLAGSGPRAPRCLVHFDDEDMCGLLEGGQVGTSLPEFELFNVFQAGPRILLDAYPGAYSDTAGRPPQVVVVGAGRMATSVVVEAARRRCLEAEAVAPMRLALVAPDATTVARRLLLRYPHLSQSCDLDAVDVDIANDYAAVSQLPTAELLPGLAFVCLDDDDDGMRATLRLRRAYDPAVSIVACSLWLADSSQAVMALGSSEATANVRGVGLLDLVCDPRALLAGDIDVLAQAFHAGYLAGERARGTTVQENPSAVAWKDLPEERRQSNREQAAGMHQVLSRGGFALVRAVDWLPPIVLSEEEVRRLGPLEHERWARYREAQGWRYGPARDDRQRLNPALVPFEQLDSLNQERTYEAVRRMPLVLAYHGFRVVRPEGGEAAGAPASSSSEHPVSVP